ncbi:MAG: hypothetical protein R3E99_12760 [Burkholderiaceae bacterium]
MGQVARLCLGTGQQGLVVVEHPVEVVDQGLHLGRERFVQALALAPAQSGERGLQPPQGHQAHPHLERHGQQQQAAQQGQ